MYVHLTGVSLEVLKNLVLAGVKAVVCDVRPVEALSDTPICLPSRVVDNDEDADKRLKFASVAHAMQASIEELNPLLGACPILDLSVEELSSDILEEYDMIVCSRIGLAQASRLSQLANQNNSKVYLVDCFGWNGVSVIDLGPNHTYRDEIKKDLLSDAKTLETYLSMDKIWTVPLASLTSPRMDKIPPPVWISYRAILEFQHQTHSWPSTANADDFVHIVQQWIKDQEDASLLELECLKEPALKQLAATAMAEMSPVCAVLGGVIGNEVIKGISGRGEPANNVILFNGYEAKCRNILVYPK